MKLWLARHGEAADTGRTTSDYDRELTDLGRRQVSQLTRWLLDAEAACLAYRLRLGGLDIGLSVEPVAERLDGSIGYPLLQLVIRDAKWRDVPWAEVCAHAGVPKLVDAAVSRVNLRAFFGRWVDGVRVADAEDSFEQVVDYRHSSRRG